MLWCLSWAPEVINFSVIIEGGKGKIEGSERLIIREENLLIIFLTRKISPNLLHTLMGPARHICTVGGQFQIHLKK